MKIVATLLGSAVLCWLALPLAAAEAPVEPRAQPDYRKEIDALRKQIAAAVEREQEAASQAKAAQQEQREAVKALKDRLSELEALRTMVEQQKKELAALRLSFTKASQTPSPQSAADARRELSGTWELVSADPEGDKNPPVAGLSFRDKQVTFRYSGGRPDKTLDYKVDATEEPKEIDVFDGAVVQGVYRIERDERSGRVYLRISVDRTGATRPAGFTAPLRQEAAIEVPTQGKGQFSNANAPRPVVVQPTAKKEPRSGILEWLLVKKQAGAPAPNSQKQAGDPSPAQNVEPTAKP